MLYLTAALSLFCAAMCALVLKRLAGLRTDAGLTLEEVLHTARLVEGLAGEEPEPGTEPDGEREVRKKLAEEAERRYSEGISNILSYDYMKKRDE